MDIWTSWCGLGCPRVSWGIKTDRLNCMCRPGDNVGNMQ